MERPRLIARFGDFVRQDEIFRQLELQKFLQRIRAGHFGVTETEKAGWAKTVFLMSTATNEQASIKIVNLKSGTIVFGYNVNKSHSARGNRVPLKPVPSISRKRSKLDRSTYAAQNAGRGIDGICDRYPERPVRQGIAKPGAKVFINVMADDFDTYVKAALTKKKVQLTIVESKEDADLENDRHFRYSEGRCR